MEELLRIGVWPEFAGCDYLAAQGTMERVKADCLRAEVDAILSDIADVLRLNDNVIEAAHESGLLRSYYWPGGERLTVCQWLELLQKFPMAPPDTSSDHRSGMYGD